MGKEVRISFLGDICPVNRVEKLILINNFSSFDDARKILKDQDLVIANLECPLIESGNKISKIGPNLKGHPRTIDLLKYLNVGIAALANNHILDYDEAGVSDTISLLKKNDIDYVGAGLNLKEAGTPLIKMINGINICLINVCEKEFNIAGNKKAGANPFELTSLLTDIKKYCSNSDFIILFYHGGVETYNLPSPGMFKNFRFLTDSGIDVIVCNHQHVFSGYQELNGKHVFYGLGNFIFDWPSLKNNPWNYGVILNLTIWEKNKVTFELVPYEQCSDTVGIAIDNNTKEKVLKELNNLNQLLTEDIIEKEWEKYVLREQRNVLANLLIQNRYFRYIIRKTGLVRMFASGEHLLRLYHYFNCLSHSELIRDTLKKGNQT